MASLDSGPDRALSGVIGSWQLLVWSEVCAKEQMAIDARLAQHGRLTLRLFHWMRPAISLGFRQPLPAWIVPERFRQQGVELVERPTGGGVALHGSDLSCSITIPRSSTPSIHQFMTQVGETMANACRAFSETVYWLAQIHQPKAIVHCLTEPSPYALLMGQRKLCGFAIRRYPESWLIQGSLLIHSLPEALMRLMPSALKADFEDRGCSLEDAAQRPIADVEVIHAIIAAWQSTWGVRCWENPHVRSTEPSPAEATEEAVLPHAL